MINFKSTGFSHVSMSTLACQTVYLCVPNYIFISLCTEIPEIQISLIYSKLKLHTLNRLFTYFKSTLSTYSQYALHSWLYQAISFFFSKSTLRYKKMLVSAMTK